MRLRSHRMVKNWFPAVIGTLTCSKRLTSKNSCCPLAGSFDEWPSRGGRAANPVRSKAEPWNEAQGSILECNEVGNDEPQKPFSQSDCSRRQVRSAAVCHRRDHGRRWSGMLAVLGHKF